MRRLWCIIGTLIVAAILLAIGAVAVRYSGAVNVGADYGDPQVVNWFLSGTSDRSVERHAHGITPPPLNDPAMVSRGAGSYRLCDDCHGAPGHEKTGFQKGLNPTPPELKESAHELSPAELFWVAKHGIRMTGMPAWGKSMNDNQIWDVVAFIEKLPKMTPEEYQAYMRAQPRRREGGEGPGAAAPIARPAEREESEERGE